MSQLLLLQGNPRKRRKGRSAAQRAATRKMLAANRSRRGPKTTARRKRRTSRRAVASAAPIRRSVRRSARRGGFVRNIGGAGTARIMPMLQDGAIRGAGAVGVDIAMGYASGVLPSNLTSRLNPDGSTNFLYYATKAALALGIGIYGRRILPPAVAAKIGEGSLAVMSYELIRGFVPSNITMGWMNPARTMGSAGRIVNQQRPQLGRVVSFGSRPLQRVNSGNSNR